MGRLCSVHTAFEAIVIFSQGLGSLQECGTKKGPPVVWNGLRASSCLSLANCLGMNSSGLHRPIDIMFIIVSSYADGSEVKMNLL